jgi:CheY-like chemotaxis protein
MVITTKTEIVHGAWDISTAIAEGSVVFFIGAGLSVGAGAPAWANIVELLRAELNPRTDEQNPLLVAQFLRNQWGEQKFRTFLRSLFTRKKLEPTKTHSLLSHLPVNVFLTTNYDDLIERSLRTHGRRVHTITDDTELAFWDERSETQVVKLHGDLDKTTRIVITEEDYTRFLYQNVGIQHKLSDIFTYKTVVFLGYSMRDPDISVIYNKVLWDLGNLKRPAYILTFENDFHLLREWERRGINAVQIPVGKGKGKTAALIGVLEVITDQVLSLQPESKCDVLIVEDDDAITYIYSELLEAMGVSFQYATDGLEASLAIGKLRPKVVILDIAMPRMNGIELAELIRKDDDLRNTRIVIATGYPGLLSKEKASDLRLDTIVYKPFSLREFQHVIERCLKWDKEG